MENAEPFKQRNIIDISSYVNKYCELYINNAVELNVESVKNFYNFFPTLLVYIFGSPNRRGWIQTKNTPEQDNAITNLLAFHSQFFKALVKLSNYPKYSINLVTDSLAADVKKILNSGTIHLLPKVYENCVYLPTNANMNSIDIRTAATKQSSLLPTGSISDRKIQFTMLQFYLYYFLSVPTWPPLPPTVNTTRSVATHSNLSPSSTTNSTRNSTSMFEVPGVFQPLSKSVYTKIFEQYFNEITLHPLKDPIKPIPADFFIDAIIELWIRTVWINTNQYLNYELVFQLTHFIKHFTRLDIRQCPDDEQSPKACVYNKLKDELFMLISRLAINWRKSDDYLLVITLTLSWITPWKAGEVLHSNTTSLHTPIQSGWALFVLDNILFYTFIMETFFQRTSIFTYRTVQPNGTSTVARTDTDTRTGQIEIVNRLFRLTETSGLVDFLSLVEKALMQVQLGKSTSTTDPFKQLSKICYKNEHMDKKIHEKLTKAYKVLVAVEGVNGVWKPKGLYAQDMGQRSESLLKTLAALNEAILKEEALKQNNTISKQPGSEKKLDSLKEAYNGLYKAFKVKGDTHLNTSTSSSLPSPTNLTNKTSRTVDLTKKTNWIRPKVVGTNGFLTPEERAAIKEGRAFCTQEHIPALGSRATSFVRSYELPVLVRWTVQKDEQLNKLYNQYIPVGIRTKFLPKSFSIRFLASRINVTYISLIMVLISYAVYKIIVYKWF